MCQQNSGHAKETRNDAEVTIFYLETGQIHPRNKNRERNIFWSWKHTWAESHLMDVALSQVLSPLIRHFTVPICHGRSKASDLLRMEFPHKMHITLSGMRTSREQGSQTNQGSTVSAFRPWVINTKAKHDNQKKCSSFLTEDARAAPV